MCLAISMIPIGVIGAINGFEFASYVLIGMILLVTFIVSIFISYFITRPIVKLTDTIDSISKGELEVNLEPSEIYEINDLTESLDRIMASLKLAVVKVGVKKDEIFDNTINSIDDSQIEPIQTQPQEENDSICTINEKANIIDCNQNMSKMLGYSQEEMLSLNLADFSALESKEEIISRINQTRNDGSIAYKTIHKRKDGSTILVEQNIKYMPNEDIFRCSVRQDNSIE